MTRRHSCLRASRSSVSGWSLVDDEDDVGLVQRPHGAEGEVLRVTRADTDRRARARPWSRPMPYVLPYVRAEDVRVPAGPAQSPAQRPCRAAPAARRRSSCAPPSSRWSPKVHPPPASPRTHRCRGGSSASVSAPAPPTCMTVRALRALHRATAVVAPCTDVGAMGRAEAIVREAAPDVAVERLVFAMTPEPQARAAALDARGDPGGGVARPRRRGRVHHARRSEPVLDVLVDHHAARYRTGPARPSSPSPASWPSKSSPRVSGTVLADDQQSFLVLPASDEAASAEDGPIAAALAGRCVARSSSTRAAATSRPSPAGCARRAGWTAPCSASCSACPGAGRAGGRRRRSSGQLSVCADRAGEVATVISFVGAGPGAPDLLTLRGADRLAPRRDRRLGVVARAGSRPRHTAAPTSWCTTRR